MGEFEAKVKEGRMLHVPYSEGTPVIVTPKKFADDTCEEWIAFENKFAGSIPDFELPERQAIKANRFT